MSAGASKHPHSTRARPAPSGGGFGGEPNPLLVRVLRQSLRIPRLPWTIAAAVALVGFGMIAFGSLTRGTQPARVGAGTFSFFVSVLLLYVALVGPATAASSIASEREGRTLEPLLLTSLSAHDVTRGKFLAAYGTLMLQVVAMLPLAAIPLLFGGVGTSELVVATVWLVVLAALAVSFGLVVASRAQTMRGALAISILLPAVAAPMGFGALTAAGELLARRRWPFLGSDPTWWTSAYSAVPFGLDYVIFLVVWPLTLVGLSMWLFLALASANLGAPGEDRSSGWKRWLLGSTLAMCVLLPITAVRLDVSGVRAMSILGQLLTAALAFMAVMLVAGEPLAPTRVVRARWERLRTGALGRGLGPGMIRGALLQIVSIALLLAACLGATVLGQRAGGLRAFMGTSLTMAPYANEGAALAILLVYTLLFDVFLVGLATFVRSRNENNVTAARAWTFAAATLSMLLPMLLMVLAGGVGSRGKGELFAAPSPIFAYMAYSAELSGGDASSTTPAAFVASLVWGALGVLLLGLSWDRTRRARDEEEKAFRAAEAKLEKEDEEGLGHDDDEDEEDEEQRLLAPPPVELSSPDAPPTKAGDDGGTGQSGSP